MATPLHFYAFLGDRYIGGSDNTLPVPYDLTDTDRYCYYSTAAQGTGVSNITRLANGTWLECVVPIAHDGRYVVQDDLAYQAIKVEYNTAGLSAWVSGGAARTIVDQAVEGIASEPNLQDVSDPPRDPICDGIFLCIGITTDADAGSLAIIQSDYTDLARQLVSEIRMTPWGNYAPIFAFVPGVKMVRMKASAVDEANALKVRQAWMDVARQFADVTIFDLDGCEIDQTSLAYPFISDVGLARTGEVCARLLRDYRQNETDVTAPYPHNGGAQRTPRSEGIGFARFSNTTDATALAEDIYFAKLDANGGIDDPIVSFAQRKEGPETTLVGDRMYGGIHPPWDRVIAQTGYFAQDLETEDYIVPIGVEELALGFRPSTRGRGIFPSQRVHEFWGDSRVDMPLGFNFQGGAHWDSNGIVPTAGSALIHWNPKSGRYWRNATHASLAAPDPAVDGRVFYAPSGNQPSVISADANFNGMDSLDFSNAGAGDRQMSLRSSGLLPSARRMTFGILLYAIDNVVNGAHIAFGSDGTVAQGEWVLQLGTTTFDLTAFGPTSAFAPMTLSVSVTPTALTHYIIWVTIDYDAVRPIAMRINGVSNLYSGPAYPIAVPVNDHIYLGADLGLANGLGFSTPWSAHWNRILSTSEMRMIEAYLATRFGVTAPTT